MCEDMRENRDDRITRIAEKVAPHLDEIEALYVGAAIEHAEASRRDHWGAFCEARQQYEIRLKEIREKRAKEAICAGCPHKMSAKKNKKKHAGAAASS